MAEYCATVWCRSAHTCFIDKPINDALRILTGCLRPTPTDNRFISAGIQPTELRHQKAVLCSARRAQEPKHLLNESFLSPLGGQLQQCRRHPFVSAASELLNNPAQSGASVARWAESRRGIKWRENISRVHTFNKDTSPTPPGNSFPRYA